MIRVLLVDDHPVVRAGYKRLLEYDSNIEVAAEASDAESAYMAFVVYHPDVTVLDLSMPGVSGLSLLQKLNFFNKWNYLEFFYIMYCTSKSCLCAI